MNEINNLFVYQPFDVRNRLTFLSRDLEKLQKEIVLGRLAGIEMEGMISKFLKK